MKRLLDYQKLIAIMFAAKNLSRQLFKFDQRWQVSSWHFDEIDFYSRVSEMHCKKNPI